jgi:hypothetical protein
MKRSSIFIIFTIALTSLLFTGCGGSSGGGGPENTAGTGNVALFVSDGPAEDCEEIWLWLEAAYLIPADENKSPVLIFESQDPHGKEINLLDLKDQKFLLSVNKQVPAGYYSKIRLIINDIELVGCDGECSDGNLEIKLPSGRIDLNPRGGFRVVPGESLAISLDMDMGKSIHIKQAGNSGKCIFRPVVFVDIETIRSPDQCPRILSGIIDELIVSSEDENEVIGFKLDLQEDRGILDVYLTDHTLIFTDEGISGDVDDLEVGQRVNVRGRLNDKCNFEASVVVIGGVEKFKGTVIDSTRNDFTLRLENDAGTLNVEITDETIILTGCDQPFDKDIIPVGYTARVFGKFVWDGSRNIYRAIVVFVKYELPSGLLVDIANVTDGYDLTIEIDGAPNLTIFLPDDASIKLKGDGRIDIERLREWVICHGGLEVEVLLDPMISDPVTAKKLFVIPDEISSVVEDKNNSLRILYTSEGNIAVEEYATIFKTEGDQQIQIEFEEIIISDEFVAFGIDSCPTDTDSDFHAFIISID